MIDIRSLDRLKTFGNSMYPILRDGDIVFIDHTPFNKIHVNDIVIFKHNRNYITHRVIYKKKDSLITKGDNNLAADPEVDKKKLIGIVTSVKREKNIFTIDNLYLIQSSFYFKELIQIVRQLQKENVTFVFLKGLPLHLYYEGNHPRRIYTDCDILISPKNMQKVERILAGRGYKKKSETLKKESEPVHKPEVSFYSTKSAFRIVFDIHVEPVFLMTQVATADVYYSSSFLRQMTEEFLNNRRNIIVEGYSFPILSVNHLIPYLSLHFFHHNFRGVFRLHFIHKVISKENDINWQEIESFIVKYRLQQFIFPVFSLLLKYFKTQIPKKILKKIVPQGLFQQYIHKNILQSNIYNNESKIQAGIHRFLLIFLLAPNPWYKKIMNLFNFQMIHTATLVILRSYKLKKMSKP